MAAQSLLNFEMLLSWRAYVALQWGRAAEITGTFLFHLYKSISSFSRSFADFSSFCSLGLDEGQGGGAAPWAVLGSKASSGAAGAGAGAGSAALGAGRAGTRSFPGRCSGEKGIPSRHLPGPLPPACGAAPGGAPDSFTPRR